MALTAELPNTRTLTLQTNGGVVQPVVGVGPQGAPGPGSAAWTALEAVTAATVRQAPDGSYIRATTSRTTRATFDATEQGFWAPVLATAGTLENLALLASIDARVPTDIVAFTGEVWAHDHGVHANDGTTVETTQLQAFIDAIPANATGRFKPGSLVLIDAQINLTGLNTTGKKVIDFTGCTVKMKGTGAQYYGLCLTGNVSNLDVLNPHIVGSGVIADHQFGIVMDAAVHATDVTFFRPVIDNITVGTSTTSDGANVQGVRFVDPLIRRALGTDPGYGYGIHHSGTIGALPHAVVYENPVVISSQRHALYSAQSDGLTVTNLLSLHHRDEVTDPTEQAAARPAIVLGRSRAVRVTGATVYGPRGGGLLIGGVAPYVYSEDYLVTGLQVLYPVDAIVMMQVGTTTPVTEGVPTGVWISDFQLTTKVGSQGIVVYAGLETTIGDGVIRIEGIPAATSVTAINVVGASDSTGTALYTDNLLIHDIPIFFASTNAGASGIGFRLGNCEVSASRVAITRCPVVGSGTVTVAHFATTTGGGMTNPNICVRDQDTPGLTFATGVTARQAYIAQAAGDVMEASRVGSAATYDGYQRTANGTLKWGFGNAPTDVSLARSQAGVITVTGNLTATSRLVAGNSNPLTAVMLAGVATSAGNVPVVAKGIALQTANLQEWRDSTDAVLARVDKNGYHVISRTAAPAGADLAAGETVIWLDPTNGADSVMFTSKTLDGTIRTGSLSPPRTGFFGPLAPSGTVSTSDVMAGLGSTATFTPRTTGKVLVTISGMTGTETAVATVSLLGKYGTGTAPANGAAASGTSFPQGQMLVRPVTFTATPLVPFTTVGTLTGLTVGTAYWIDLAFHTNNAADKADLSAIVVVIQEVA